MDVLSINGEEKLLVINSSTGILIVFTPYKNILSSTEAICLKYTLFCATYFTTFEQLCKYFLAKSNEHLQITSYIEECYSEYEQSE